MTSKKIRIIGIIEDSPRITNRRAASLAQCSDTYVSSIRNMIGAPAAKRGKLPLTPEIECQILASKGVDTDTLARRFMVYESDVLSLIHRHKVK